MLKTEVTQKFYVMVMGKNPSYFSPENKEELEILPVECVSYFDCLYFCNKLSILLGLEPVYSIDGETDITKWEYTPHKRMYINDFSHRLQINYSANGYRLPTEDLWEYAANCGKSYYPYAGISEAHPENVLVHKVAWNSYNSSRTHPVGALLPNDFGLFDMCGNVWEMCHDDGIDFCLKGGSFDKTPYDCKINNYGVPWREMGSEYHRVRSWDVGFRIVCSAE